MADLMSFKKYLTQLNLEESTIPTVWGNRTMNVAPEEEESTENQEDELEMDTELDSTDDLGMEDDMDMGNDIGMEDDPEEDDEDPNKQGVIRKVKGAHLVYKRQDEEGTYEELWIYKLTGEVKDDLEIRRDILAGTDIPQNKTKSEDDTQSYDLWTSGNVQWLKISNLPN
jgi:hypothetical protein